MKPILCVVATSASSFGLAVSDAYLGSARPLPSVTSLADAKDTCLEERVGALTLALPLQHGSVERQRAAEILRDRLYLELVDKDPLKSTTSVPPALLVSKMNCHMSLEEARQLAVEQVEMWEDVDFDDDSSPSTDAAVALNCFLWKYTGGWANTFG
eukprot:scaffold2033_cov164-Amphora_coffeaeformis.AAC.13